MSNSDALKLSVSLSTLKPAMYDFLSCGQRLVLSPKTLGVPRDLPQSTKSKWIWHMTHRRRNPRCVGMVWPGIPEASALRYGNGMPYLYILLSPGSGMKVHTPPGQAQASPAELPQTAAFTKCEHKCLCKPLSSAGGMPVQHKYARSHVFPRTLRLKHLSSLNSQGAPDNVMFGSHSAAASALPSSFLPPVSTDRLWIMPAL